MPPILKKQVAGLPLYAWVGITIAAVGVGYYVHNRNKAKEAAKQEGEPKPEGKGYDSGNPCDPNSSAYEPASCNQGSQFSYVPYGPEAGAAIASQPAASGSEKTSAEEGGVINIFTQTPPTTPQGVSCTGRKPRDRKGFKVVCVNGKWAYEPSTHAGKKKRNKTAAMTGGGPPSANAHEKLAVG